MSQIYNFRYVVPTPNPSGLVVPSANLNGIVVPGRINSNGIVSDTKAVYENYGNVYERPPEFVPEGKTYIVSWVYPVVNSDVVSASYSLVNIKYGNYVLEDSASVSFSLNSVSSLQLLKSYTIPEEITTASLSIDSVESRQILLNYTIPEEVTTASFSLNSVTLLSKLITYSNYAEEQVSASFSLNGVTVS